MAKINITCISDTHGMEDQINMPPGGEGDLLIHAGDITMAGEFSQLEKFNDWIAQQKYEKKVVIPGNHDRTIPEDPQARALLTHCDLLIDSYTTFRGLKIYGSPWTPKFGGPFWVYNKERGTSIKRVWEEIPSDTDILVTHGPPFGILDSVRRTAQGQGCRDLLNIVKRIKPKLHVFGHLHDNHGKKNLFRSDIMFINASTCTEQYNPVNPPIQIQLEL